MLLLDKMNSQHKVWLDRSHFLSLSAHTSDCGAR